jgi:hypothetical protein
MSDISEKQLQREADDQAPWAAEEKRLRAIRNARMEKGQCILCGQPLGFFDKYAKRTQHKDCVHFKE